MDIIEEGFSAVMQKVQESKNRKGALSQDIKENDAALLGRMAELAKPLISSLGLAMLVRGKQDGKGEIYNAQYHSQKMLMLGKTDPLAYRPDDMSKQVTSQYCVLTEDGQFMELMYSVTDFIIDSYEHVLTPEEVIDLYGYDIMFMLYRALHDYLKDERELVDAMEMTLAFVFQKQEPQQE